MDLFDYKPELVKRDGQECPDEFLKGRTFAFTSGTPKLMGTPRKFQQCGKSGSWLSDAVPNFHADDIVDEMCFIHSMNTEQFNHAPAEFRPGTRCNAPVSLLDLYPTLIEACGLPKRVELEGHSLLPLIANPRARWSEAVVSTIGRGSHSVFANGWRYVRWFDGSEELYDLEKDPHEWVNLAGKPGHKKLKQRLAGHIPEDDRLRQFVRHGSLKCVVPVAGAPMLFDYHAPFDISEQNDLAAERPAELEAILA